MTIPDQPDLTNDELRELLDPYRAAYPVEYDDELARFACGCCFHREDVEAVATWKFRSDSRRLASTLKQLAKNSDFDIENLTSRAFRCHDDLAALLLVEQLTGVGKALGSAILMASDPCRYTVIDRNAVLAVQALGYLRDCPRPTTAENSLPPWDRYLAAVRDIAARTGWSLRKVDRALYKAGR
jgi:hypothetical protein